MTRVARIEPRSCRCSGWRSRCSCTRASARPRPGVHFASMMLVGALLFGPDALISGAAAQDAGGARAAATAVGVVNGMGSAGALLQGALAVGVKHAFGWNALFYVFFVLALIASACLLPALRIAAQRGLTLRPVAATRVGSAGRVVDARVRSVRGCGRCCCGHGRHRAARRRDFSAGAGLAAASVGCALASTVTGLAFGSASRASRPSTPWLRPWPRPSPPLVACAALRRPRASRRALLALRGFGALLLGGDLGFGLLQRGLGTSAAPSSRRARRPSPGRAASWRWCAIASRPRTAASASAEAFCAAASSACADCIESRRAEPRGPGRSPPVQPGRGAGGGSGAGVRRCAGARASRSRPWRLDRARSRSRARGRCARSRGRRRMVVASASQPESAAPMMHARVANFVAWLTIAPSGRSRG